MILGGAGLPTLRPPMGSLRLPPLYHVEVHLSMLEWVRLPVAAVLDERLQRSDMLLYALLLDRCDRSTTIAITAQKLAQLSGLSDRTVRRSLQRLQDVQLITVRRTGRASDITVKEIISPKQRSTQRRTAVDAATSLQAYAACVNRFKGGEPS